MKDENELQTGEVLKVISTRDFLGFGVGTLAYIKAINENKDTKYGVFAADGQKIASFDNKNTALTIIIHNDLEPVTLH
tara:strand:+ start:108 stop:341 length:234 start_codon:yes stop_codon:yes gene_type:complete